MSAIDPQEQGSRRSRVDDPLTDEGPGSMYDDQEDALSIASLDDPPLPMKPPGSGIANSDPHLAGNSADEYFNDIATTPSDGTPPTTAQALSRRRTSSHGLSHSHSHSHSSRRTRSHSSARDILRLLLSEGGSESREALALLRRAQERLEVEGQRANEAERRVQEANERWRLINQARLQALAEASRTAEELRLYKLQLEASQQQIARANDMIALTDKERAHAEDEAAKARRLAKKYEMEQAIRRAREEGRREGRREGRQEVRELAAYQETRHPPDYRDRDRLRDRERQLALEPYPEDDVDEYTAVDEDPNAERGPPAEIVEMMQRRQQTPRSAPPNVIPSYVRSTESRGSHRSNGGVLNSLSRLGRSDSRRGMDRNVALNPSDAPDVATIVEDEPRHTLTSPLPPERTSQLHHTTPTRMPQPNFNPDPSEVPPISLPNQPRSPMHPQTIIPPEGYIPRQDIDGSIRLPPPHEMGHAPPTPHSYSSPLPNAANLPPPADPELPQREREPISRDFAEQPSRSRSRHRYQKSVAESDDTMTTASLSIISPPGVGRSAMQPRLSAIPEHDVRYASPSGSMRRADAPVYPNTPRSRSIRPEDEGIYVPGDPVLDPALANRQSMANEGPVRPMDMAGTFSPRSGRSGFAGPRRPQHITTPAPLAPNGLGQSEYTRPRINSMASGSEIAGFTGTPRPSQNRQKTPGPEYRRSRPGSAANTGGFRTPPEINIVPASRSESLQSRKSNVPRTAGVMSPRRTQSYTPQVPIPAPVLPPQPEPPSPVNIPGMPKGFVPTSPMAGTGENLPTGFVPTTPTMPTVHRVPDGAPRGFVPVSPAAPPGAPLGFVPTSPMPPGAPLGFVPTSPAPPGAPLGFVPTSPAVPPGAPLGFIPTSPAVPDGAPPGFVPVSPAVPDGAPVGFVPVSPNIPAGAPVGFVPTSTTIPVNPLPQSQWNTTVSPNMSMTGALPVLARSASERSAGHTAGPGRVQTGSSSATNRSPRIEFSGPNAGFNSRAASDWDTNSAWGGWRIERSPRPVRGPDLSAAVVRPGSSISSTDSNPVIPDPTAFRPSRQPSRVGFNVAGDPAAVPLPASTAPSLGRSGRANSHAESRSRTPGPGVTRSQSARSDSSRARIYPPPGTPAHPSVPGLPPTGLASPYSRRLDVTAEDAEEYEVVPSDDSENTLTTPPGRRQDLPPGGNTPRVAARNSFYTRSPAGSQRHVSLSVHPDNGDEPMGEQSLRRSASTRSIGSNKSYARFDPGEYVDPAVLTSGVSRLLPLPPEEPVVETTPAGAKGKKSKGKKGKGKGR